ncbi:unnamed protein product [Phytophthora lilii]|uniref:Unnamed protein product n=1 Tax=Phytophthora lilii TaxID=2077276 RepID=A0A9W6UBA2_9STRA|nr:unnamed protein product [Phytophthora lilii]
MSLLTPIPMQTQENSATVTENHLCIQSDITIIEQKCNEIMQQGDVHISEGEQQAGLSCFSEALKMLSDVKLQHASQRLSRMKARCWRKYTQQQSLLCDFSDSASVEILLALMKKLKRSMKCCDAGLEKVKCMLELGRINVRLLRSSSPRAFFSLEQTLALLEEAYLHGDCLGIPHLSQALRTSLGMAYFAEIEEYSRNNSDTIDKNSRSRFLCWASGALLANAESVGVVDLNTPPSDTDTDITAQEALTMQLQQLTACPIESQQHTRDKIEEMAQITAKNVRQLPDTWTIISLTIGLSSELVITRFSVRNT